MREGWQGRNRTLKIKKLKLAEDKEAEIEAQEIKDKSEALKQAEEQADAEAEKGGKDETKVQKLRDEKKETARPRRTRKTVSKTKKS